MVSATEFVRYFVVFRTTPRNTARDRTISILYRIYCLLCTVEKVRGEPLLLNRVDRSQMGHYLCIASNDVPPAVSKRITLNVNCEYTDTHTNVNIIYIFC